MAARIQVASLFFNIEGDTKDLEKGLAGAEKTIKAAFGKMTSSGGKVIDTTDKLEKSMNRTGKSSVDLASKIFVAERAYSTIKNIIAGGVDMAKLGASMERVERRFGLFAEAAGGSTAILEAFQRGAGGTVDKMSAMAAASALLQQGLVNNATEMEKTVELATRLGDQTVSATNRINDFSQLLRNQSIQLLDNFGISSGKVRESIKELQKATEGLSREEAFRIAVFEQGQKSLVILGERVDDNATKFEQAEAKLADFRIEMGEKFAPIAAGAIEQLTKMDTVTLTLVTGMTGLIGTAAKLSGGMSGLIEKLGLTGGQFGLLVASVGLAIVAYETYGRLQDAVSTGQESVNKTLATWNDLANEAVSEGKNLNNVITDMAKRVNAANEQLNKNGDIIEDLVTAFVRATKGNEIMRDAAIEATRVIRDQASSIEEANRLVDIYNSTLSDGVVALDDFTQATFRSWSETEKSGKALGQWAAQAIESGAVADFFKGVLDKVGISEEDLSAEIDKLKNGVEKLKDAFVTAIPKMEKTAEVQKLLVDSVVLGNRALARANAAAGKYDEALEAQAEAIEKTKVAQEEANEALKESIRLGEEQLQTLQDQVTAQLDQAEALKGAGEQEIARAAINQLKKAQEEGLITFNDFTQAVVEIQDKFGLADDESRALTLGLGMLVDEFVGGGIAAGDFDEALGLLIEDAKDGVLAFDELKSQIGQMNMELDTTRTIFDALTGQFVSAASLGQRGENVINAGPATGGGVGSIIDALTGQVVQQQQAQGPSGTQIFIENLNLTGIQDAEAFLASLQSVTG